MKIDTAYTNQLHRLQEIKHVDQRYQEKVQEAALVKYQHQVEEAHRIEMNRRMNRPGQNIDKMA
jgi:hypothetical protein